jgi:GPH family glycoside/pentoside/hexuronide:cation symporter
MNNGDPGAAGTWPAWLGTISALSTCFLVIPIITWLSQRLGKKNTFIVSQGVSLLGYAMFWWCFQPENPLLMFLPLPLFAFGIGGLFTLMMSMTADVCDLDELETGSRREGLFGAIYWWMVKVGFAVAGLLSGLILALVGFDQSVPVQTEAALSGLRFAYILVPMAGTLLAMWVMKDYDLSEQKAYEIRRRLDDKRAA